MSDEITKQTVKRIARKEARTELESQLAEINGEEQKSLASSRRGSCSGIVLQLLRLLRPPDATRR